MFATTFISSGITKNIIPTIIKIKIINEIIIEKNLFTLETFPAV